MRGLALAILAVILLAGCSSSPKAPAVEPGEIELPPGSLGGVVVDEALRPISRATVELVDANQSMETDKEGVFRFDKVAPGTHFLRATHPLFSSAQQTAEVMEDGTSATVRIQLTRVIFAQPYAQLQKFEGFIVCSIGFFEYASEECGQGVGVPCEVPVPPGCTRVGGQGNNHAQWDFYLDGPFVRTLVVEMTWEPTSATLTEFQLNVANDWTCDPLCNGKQLNVTGGPSPLYATVDFPRELEDRDGNPTNLTSDTRFSTFVWPNWGCANFGVPSPECAQQHNVAINQQFTQFATAFYYLPAPAGWSFVAGDEVPT